MEFEWEEDKDLIVRVLETDKKRPEQYEKLIKNQFSTCQKLIDYLLNQPHIKNATFNFAEVIQPVNPLKIRKHKVTKKDIENLKNWASLWDSLRDSVFNSVFDSLWAYTSSLFPNIKKWKYIDREEGINPFQHAIDLWRCGFVPSFDGKIWHLH